MIQLHSDSLWFETNGGAVIPCSVEALAVELVGGADGPLDAELIHNAAQAVLHYFRHDLGRAQVTVGDFAEVFAKILRGFGLSVRVDEVETVPGPVAEADLLRLAADSGKGFELVFFARLRAELRQALADAPRVIRFTGLRDCVKQLAGVRRWNHECQRLSDQIVGYLRDCLVTEPASASCSLVVQ